MGEKIGETLEVKHIEDGQIISEITGEWQAVTKNMEGEAEIHTLTKRSIKARPAPLNAESIEQLLVRQAAPSTIRPLPKNRRRKTEEYQILVGGDAQFPFADPDAIELFQQVAREVQPKEVVLVGDMTDFPALSRFEQRKEWVGSTQQGIDEYYTFLAQLRASTPDSKITVVHGNHEQRLIKSLERNLAEVAGIRQALSGTALLSVQNLARYGELEIDYVDGYPNGTYWAADNLKFVHGTNTKKGGFNVGKYLQEERETTIFGHTHRLEFANRTFATRLGSVTIAAASPGGLCLTDGTVPGFHYTANAEGGVVKKAEDWQQGALLVTVDGLHHEIELGRFTEKGVRLEGKRYKVDQLEEAV